MKAKLALMALCLMLTFPLSAELVGSAKFSALAGHTKVGAFCAPCCEQGPCVCEEGEPPAECDPVIESSSVIDPGAMLLVVFVAVGVALRLRL